MNHNNEPDPANTLIDQEVEQALQLLRRENRRYAARFVCSGVSWSCGVMILVPWVAASAKGYTPNVVFLLFSLLCIMAGAVTLPRSRSKALKILAARQDVRTIGPLLNALDYSHGAKTQAIESLLSTLLPRLKVSDNSLLNHVQRVRLNGLMLNSDADHNIYFLLAILKGLEQIGDKEALRCVRELVRRGAVTAGQRRVLEAAQECLSCLEARVEQQQNSANLLRAAAPFQNAAELLRPNQSPPETQPETLLRHLE